MSKSYVFTDSDLDGVGSYLVSKWLIDNDMPFTTTTVKNFHEDFVKWNKLNKVKDYEKVYIFDINVAEYCDLLDYDNVVIIDHHNGKDGYTGYKKATLVLDQKCTSTTKLVLKTLLQNNPDLKSKLSVPKAKLITLIDDYDSYQLKDPNSLGINTVLWSYTGNRIQKFIEEFYDGFRTFTKFQINMISIAKKKVEEAVETYQAFSLTLPIDGKESKIVSTFCDHNINEVAHGIIKKYQADIGIVVNLKSKSVSLRKSKQCSVNLNKLAAKLCEGGGHFDSAGGSLNKTFIKFSKLFKKI